MKLGDALIELSEKILDRTIEPEHIRIFIITRYFTLLKESRSLIQDAKRDLKKTHDTLLEMKWISPKDADLDFLLSEEVDLTDKVAQWKTQLPNGRALNKNVIAAGTGKYLYWLEINSEENNYGFIQTNLENLLRHVEISRKSSLQEFSPDLSGNQIWLEKHDISLLFMRHAQNKGDLRFLNAVLKMNDWYYPYYLKRTTNSRSARYLLALVEQERAIKEMLP